jgi:hypothetical protein
MKTSNQQTAKKTPSFVAYYVPDREGADWMRIPVIVNSQSTRS